MSCVGNVCGTGGWNGPLPGDPDDNVTLTVLPAFGGIDVIWTLPLTNPFAVSYVEVWRATTASILTAIKIKDVPGTDYFDRVEAGKQYWYWIRIVSINGTLGGFVGPGSAVAKSSVEQTMRDLTGMIDAGLLSQELKKEIERITLTDNKLVNEIRDRLAALSAISLTIEGMQSEVAQAVTLILDEVTERIEGDSALVEAVDAIGAGAANSIALISTEREARVSADSALGSRIDTVRTDFGTAIGSAVQQEASARASADQSLASQITQTESALNGNVAQVQQSLSTTINTLNGKLQEIGALYTVKLNVNGLAGGFGVYNDGHVVQAGFDVDQFFIGRTNANKIKPFIIVDDTVYINSAAINRLEVSKITSGEMNAEWRMRGENGRIVMDNGAVMKVQGTGFGQNRDLISWFGPSMPVGACTKANATTYEALDGSAYWGGALRAGVLYNAQRTTQIAYNAEVPLGPFWSNGNPRSLVVSYSYYQYMQSMGQGNDQFQFNGGDTWVDVQLFKGNTLIAGSRFNGAYNIMNESDGPDVATISIGGSFTFTDTGPAGNYTYTARIVGRSLANISHNSGSLATNDISQSLGIISTEV